MLTLNMLFLQKYQTQVVLIFNIFLLQKIPDTSGKHLTCFYYRNTRHKWY